MVVIWKSKGEGLLKYNHASPVLRVKFHPTLMKLLSCSEVTSRLQITVIILFRLILEFGVLSKTKF